LALLAFFRLFCSHTTSPAIFILSLHVALPISPQPETAVTMGGPAPGAGPPALRGVLLQVEDLAQLGAHGAVVFVGGHDLAHVAPDRKSTRLNSSHVKNSYAVFCLKKKRQSYRT